mgnify:CR=1 FL=1
MSYNGSGAFSINTAGQPVVAATTISSTVFNAFTADIATGLSTAICKDGQTTTTGVIPFALGLQMTGTASNINLGANYISYGGTDAGFSLDASNNATFSANISVVGGSMIFPATAVPNANANALDDYEEGTWTPTDASGASLSFTTVSGVYTKIGRVVIAAFKLTYPVTADASQATIGSLPFTNSSNTFLGGFTTYSDVTPLPYWLIASSATTVQPYSAAAAFYTNESLSTKILRATLIYMV